MTILIIIYVNTEVLLFTLIMLNHETISVITVLEKCDIPENNF